MPRWMALIAAVAVALVPTGASATTVTMTLSGRVSGGTSADNFPGFAFDPVGFFDFVDETATASFTFTMPAPDANSDPTIGAYKVVSDLTAAYSNGVTMSAPSGKLVVLDGHDGSDPESLGRSDDGNGLLIVWGLVTAGTVITLTDLEGNASVFSPFRLRVEFLSPNIVLAGDGFPAVPQQGDFEFVQIDMEWRLTAGGPPLNVSGSPVPELSSAAQIISVASVAVSVPEPRALVTIGLAMVALVFHVQSARRMRR